MNLNVTKNSKKSKASKKFIQTESNIDEVKEAKVTNTEANAYIIFPEIRKSSNNFRDIATKRNSKTKNSLSLPAI